VWVSFVGLRCHFEPKSSSVHTHVLALCAGATDTESDSLVRLWLVYDLVVSRWLFYSLCAVEALRHFQTRQRIYTIWIRQLTRASSLSTASFLTVSGSLLPFNQSDPAGTP
jgi:hypothetical protein